MSVATATPDQLKQLDDFVVLARGATTQLWQLDKTINSLIQAWNANILGIIGPPQGTLIKDSTNYAGAVQLTDTQVTNLFGILQTLHNNTMTDPNKALFVLASGPNNML